MLPLLGLAASVGGGAIDKLMGGGGGDAPAGPTNQTANSGGGVGGAFVFGAQNKSSPWPVIVLVGVLVLGLLVWIGLRKRR